MAYVFYIPYLVLFMCCSLLNPNSRCVETIGESASDEQRMVFSMLALHKVKQGDRSIKVLGNFSYNGVGGLHRVKGTDRAGKSFHH